MSRKLINVAAFSKLSWAFAAGLLLAWAETASAIEIEEVVWGFDGTVVLNEFNPLTIIVSNPSPEPFNGKLRLKKSLAGNYRIGANIDEPVFLSAFGPRRLVQFYPYITSQMEEWTVSWGRGPKERFKLTRPRIGVPARVILSDPNGLGTRSRGLKQFSDDFFPPTVSACAGLDTVLLDHVPNWRMAKRQALLDWVHRGGKLHLLLGPNGSFPKFPAPLAVLNAPLEKQRIGAGLIVRHRRSRIELDSRSIRALIDGGPTGGVKQSTKDTPKIATEPSADIELSDVNLNPYQSWDAASSFFSHLKQMTRPNHNWPLIYLISGVYMLLIFPGCYLLGIRRVDYRLTFGALLGIVVVFSVVFSAVGRRGYGESTAVHSVAIARPLSGGAYDVIQWSNAFVTRGDKYRITHDGTGRLYSTCDQAEAVSGIIDNGLEGVFVADIPPYSSRTFAHRVKIKARPIQLKVETWQAGENLEQLVVSVAGNFPNSPIKVDAMYRDQMYIMTVRPDSAQPAKQVLKLVSPSGPISTNLRIDQYNAYQSRLNPWQAEDTRAAEQRFRELLNPLLLASLQVTTQKELEKFALPDDRVRLFVYAKMPDNFFARSQPDRFGKQDGYVLYCLDVFKPASPP